MTSEQIIALVKNTPVIWQSSHYNYKKRKVLIRTWRQLAKTLDVEENFLKKRWKHLKDQYRKEYKKVLACNQADPDEVEVTWHYYNDLSFLKNEMFNRGRKTQAETAASECSISEHESETEASAPKKKMEDGTKNVPDQSRLDMSWQSDADYMFLMSILPTLKSLSEIQKLQFRGKVNDWLIEAYTQNAFANEYASPSTEADSKMYLQSQLAKKRGDGRGSSDPLDSE